MENKYKKYYEGLKNSQVTENSTKIVSAGENLGNAQQKLTSQISGSTWEELGIKEIKTAVIPKLTSYTTTLKSNFTVLQSASSKSMELVPLIEKLESEINKYNNCKEEEYSAKATYSSNIRIYESQIEAKITEIKGLNANIKEIETTIEVSTESSDAVSFGNISTNKMVQYTFDGEKYLVSNTKLPLNDYLKIIEKNHIAQRFSSNYNDKCLGFSYAHAADLYYGSTNHNGDGAAKYSYSYKKTESLQTWSKDTAIEKIVSEVSKGRPVILQVNGNKQGTRRHFVTVVGMKESAASSGKVQEKDLLVLDSYDGKVKTLDTSKDKYRFMTQGKNTGNGNYGYYCISLDSHYA